MEPVLVKTMEQEVSGAAVQEKQLLLSRLLGRLAHEIPNPLSSLGIHVLLLEQDGPRSAPRMTRRSSVHLPPGKLAKVAPDVGALLHPEAGACGIEIALQPAESPLPPLWQRKIHPVRHSPQTWEITGGLRRARRAACCAKNGSASLRPPPVVETPGSLSSRRRVPRGRVLRCEGARRSARDRSPGESRVFCGPCLSILSP